MKKILMVIIGGEENKKLCFNVIIIPIICNASDERDIKYALESRKNDPRTLLAIMTRHLSRETVLNQKKKFGELKCIVEKCDTLIANFIHPEELTAKIAAQDKNSILHDFHLN